MKTEHSDLVYWPFALMTSIAHLPTMDRKREKNITTLSTSVNNIVINVLFNIGQSWIMNWTWESGNTENLC